ncbi:MAG: 2-C-methyl-D-erythritol 4-phosphate cytidylyltransferase [Fermentimonas sp.]|jgi:2-C-methyl-D-erythritol 4-phosphate cytidylyltransferase
MIPEKQNSVIIVAGGKGLRAGGEVPKQFSLISGRPLLMYTIDAFCKFDYRMKIVVVLPKDYIDFWRQLCSEHEFGGEHEIVEGGSTRFHSVRNGLERLPIVGTIGVHDGARPFVTPRLIGRCYETSFKEDVGVVPVVDSIDSLRSVRGGESKIVDRNEIKVVQTPQVFPAEMLKRAYRTEYKESFTDDASVVEAMGEKILLVEGEPTNIKITTPFDLELAEFYKNYMAKS